MQEFARWKKTTAEEAWYMLRGEQMLGKFALQGIAFGYTPESFKKEFVETDKQSQDHPARKQKQEAM